MDEVLKKIGEADGFGGQSSYIASPSPPLERRDISPQLRMTLEHIVGQLTQVCRGNISEQGIILETKSLGGGVGMHSC